MGSTTTTAAAVGSLAAIAICMFIFVCWWFPRQWRKGVALDMERVDAEKAELERLQRLGLAPTPGATTTTTVAADGTTITTPAQAAVRLPPRGYTPMPVAGY